jgi:hypothetical protein
MAYALLYDQFYDHPKLIDLLEHEDGLAAVGLWSLALGWAKRHSNPHCPDEAGHIPASLPRRLGGSTELAKLLVGVGLWTATGGGWMIHDFAHWQDLEGWAKRSAKAKVAVKSRWDAKRRLDAALMSSQETDTPSTTPSNATSNTDVIPTSPHLTSPKDLSPTEIEEPCAKIAQGGVRAQDEGQLFAANDTVAAVKPRGRPLRQNTNNPAFAEWYAAYPLHTARGAAEQSYDRAVREGADPQVLLHAAVRYRDDDQVLRGYAKHPATWLNQKCWLDEATPPPAAVSRHQQETDALFAAAMRRAQDKEAREGLRDTH